MSESSESDACGCPSNKLYLSLEEEAVLTHMRDLTRRARDLRARLRAGPPGPWRARLEQELAELRRQFESARVALRQANEEKLRRLGHIP